MADDTKEQIYVTAEDASRWAKRLLKMAQISETREGRDPKASEDNAKMFYTCAMLTAKFSRELTSQIQGAEEFEEAPEALFSKE